MKTTQATYQDDIEAIAAEHDWQLGLDHGRTPFTSEVSIHLGEGGATTTWQQDGKLVGVSTRIRDEFNRTLLVTVDLREAPASASPADDARLLTFIREKCKVTCWPGRLYANPIVHEFHRKSAWDELIAESKL